MSNLEEVISRIQQKWGHLAIQPAHRLRMEQKTAATGFAALDDLIQGVPCGQVTEIVDQLRVCPRWLIT